MARARSTPALTLALLASLGPAAGRLRGDDGGPPPAERVYYDGLDAQGRLTGGSLMLPIADLAGLGLGPAAGWTTIVDNGPPANRIDVVFVGDGYLQTQLAQYAAHVANGLDELITQEPFLTYSTYFNFHRVDVISNESGVDNDPVEGILRDTALDMGFWCNGIERLLCVNVSAAYQFASNAPEVDHVLAVANSTKYGGAGYTSSDLATFSGGNVAAPEVAIHEMGHSLGDLADEYDYGGPAQYNGPEPQERNISTLEAPEMADLGTKWAPWLGDPGIGFSGIVGTYEGASYSQFGIYRPTFNSKMRSLGVPFNLPSAEGLIIETYKLVDLLDDHSPTGGILDGTETLFVAPLQPVGHSLDVQWLLDCVPIPGATGTMLDLASLNLAGGAHRIAVTVTDHTPLVRDEAARALYMTRTLDWEAQVTPAADLDGDLAVGVTDLLIMLAAWGPCAGPCPPSCAGDLDGDCTVSVGDLLAMLATWGPAGFTDCNGNAIPDCDELVAGSSPDCNGNGVPDECDIDAQASQDCDGNGVPDECGADCNGNGSADECDIAGGSSFDCNGNGVPDECEEDCNGNGLSDSCDIAGGESPDCNGNDVPDECDVAEGTSQDLDGNGVPDECQGPPANDLCANAAPIAEGAALFSTFFATTDGLPLVCDGQSTPFVKDVWYTYTPQCTGTATIGTCNGAGFDTIVAVYFAGSCPPSAALSCSNDAPGCGLTSSVQLQVFAGFPYLIRIGGTQGAGTLTISCAP